MLFLSLCQGRAANKFGLLTGQIVAVDTVQLSWLVGVGLAVLLGLAVIWRQLLFVSADPEVAVARGLPTAWLSVIFGLLLLLLLVLAAAMAVQVVSAPAGPRVAGHPRRDRVPGRQGVRVRPPLTAGAVQRLRSWLLRASFG